VNNKNIVVSVIGAAVILGLAIILSAMVNNGLILQKENVQPKENILTTTVGHVNLGKVYSESRGMDIILINSEDKSPAAITLTDIDPDNFSKELHQALEKIAKDVNKSQGLTNEKALKPETLSGSVQFKLKIKTYMNYRSEYMPMYTLMIKDEDIIIDKGEGLESRITAEGERIAKDSLLAFSLSTFIKNSK